MIDEIAKTSPQELFIPLLSAILEERNPDYVTLFDLMAHRYSLHSYSLSLFQ